MSKQNLPTVQILVLHLVDICSLVHKTKSRFQASWAVSITDKLVSISGRTVTISGRMVPISGRTVSISGSTVSISGNTIKTL